ncbi:DUF7269 family protein [Haloarcula pellucida]|uniref:Uncharacterized protein n=1 Tax=Haloarcula pellucida TaxID=1427151 RepID=A0A830GLG7_9EURY|nr:hypothetical protein [Halomicroarcula pellucida]MBX0349733.1 hypothetical protein [Halomicroarcula pellucida]GGN94050.1 hypothetical protein GCM10009030_20010 [Halomicroarcula pellucida]
MTEPTDLGLDGLEDFPWARIVLGGVGFLVMVGAFVTAGDLAGGVVSSLRDGVDNDYLLVMVFGGVAVALGALVFLTSTDSVRVRQMPAVEQPTPAPEPGERFDEQLDGWRPLLPVVGRQSRDAVRERLRQAAVRTVAAERGWPEAKAATAVAEGSWTEDPVAARFLAHDEGSDVVGTALTALARGETPIRYRARRTMAAIVERHDGTRGRPR